MSWADAKDRTVEQWRGIREALGNAHPTDLLTEINLICSLCDAAAAERAADPEPAARCAYCIAYHQAGGCRHVCGEISARVAERDWDAARDIADHFIDTLQGLQPPAKDGEPGH